MCRSKIDPGLPLIPTMPTVSSFDAPGHWRGILRQPESGYPPQLLQHTLSSQPHEAPEFNGIHHLSPTSDSTPHSFRSSFAIFFCVGQQVSAQPPTPTNSFNRAHVFGFSGQERKHFFEFLQPLSRFPVSPESSSSELLMCRSKIDPGLPLIPTMPTVSSAFWL